MSVRRLLIVEVGALRMRLALLLTPADLRDRTWRLWLLDRAAADEALAVGENAARAREQAKAVTFLDVLERIRAKAPYN